MTRKFNRKYSLSVVVPFIAILTLLIAAAVLAQMPGADRSSGVKRRIKCNSSTLFATEPVSNAPRGNKDRGPRAIGAHT
jgi:hypothetical protein